MYAVVILPKWFADRKMASGCSLSALFPLQSQLDFSLEEAASQREKEELVQNYLKTLDQRDELRVPDFQPGELSLRFSELGQ